MSRPKKLFPSTALALTVLISTTFDSANMLMAAEDSYTGLGADSITPEVMKSFAAPALESSMQSRIQAMLDVRTPSLGYLTPDGSRLFIRWNITGTGQIWRLDGPMRFPAQMTGGEDPTRVSGITPDGKSLLVARDRKGEENPGLYLQSTTGGPLALIQHLPGVRTSLHHITDDSRYVFYAANDRKPDSYTIYRYDMKTKTKEIFFDQEGLWTIRDQQGDKFLLRKSVGSLMGEYHEFDAKTKTLTPLLGIGEQEDYNAVYAATPGELLVLTPKLSEFRKLYRYKGGQFTAISPDLKADVMDFSVDRGKTRILMQINDGGYLKIGGLDAKTYRTIPVPTFKNADHVYFAITTPNGRFTTIGVESAATPRTNYVYDWKTKKLTEWVLPSSPEIDSSSFARASLEYYPARDGTKIPMFVRRPQSCKEPCPVVVSFHGGPEAQTFPGFSTTAQLFVEAGFIFVEPNVRGSDGYGKTWLAADNGAKRLDVITDIADAAAYIKTAWAKDGKAPKIGVTGYSYGGYSTLMAMSMFAGSYDAGVALVGMSNLVTFLNNTAPYRRRLRTSEYGDPEKDRDVLLKLSPISYLEKVSGPLMIIQGATDPRVPVGEAVQMHAALKAKNIPSELIIFPDEGHGSQKRENQVLEIGHTLQFFKKHLL